MDAISRYLAKFHTLTPPVKTIKRVCAEVIKEEVGITISEEDIAISGSCVQIHGSAALKQEIFMRKNALCERINTQLTPHGFSVSDIR